MRLLLQHQPENAQDLDRVRRILFIRFGGIGDILLTTPTLRAVKQRFPDAQIDYLVNGGFRDVLQGHPSLHSVIEFYKRGYDVLPHRFGWFLYSLRRANYDLVVNLQPSVKTVLMTWATSARHSLVFRKDQSVQPDTLCRRHAINDFYETVLPLNVPVLRDRSLDFEVPPSPRAVVECLLCNHGYAPGMRLVVLHPAANHRVNRWPVSHFAAVCNTLARRQDHFVVLTGHRKDKPLCGKIRESSDWSERCLDLTGKLSLKELGALIARADAFVTGDTGPMHIASALGVPVISLFGAADPERTRPLSAGSRVLIDRSLACAPCHTRTCRFGKEARCMQKLLPRTVIAAVDDTVRHSLRIGSLHTEAV